MRWDPFEVWDCKDEVDALGSGGQLAATEKSRQIVWGVDYPPEAQHGTISVSEAPYRDRRRSPVHG